MPCDHPKILFYANTALTNTANHGLPGVARFADLFRFFTRNTCFVDRTEALRFPIRTAIWGPMPKFRRVSTTYEELCDERAVEILDHAEKLDLPLYVLYSGGIDSTLILVSMIKNAKPGQLDRLVVLLSQSSIAENPGFFRKHILGKLRLQVAAKYPLLLNKKAIVVCGELNDQLMGSDLTSTLATVFGSDKIQAKYDRDVFLELWCLAVKDRAVVNWHLDRLEMIKAASPIPIDTNVDFLWWLNFSLKWQSVVFRILSYVSDYNLRTFDKELVERHFFAFFGTEGFQLWSMNSPDKKIRDSWESYKFVAKDIIFAFDKDDDYRRHKTKQASLPSVVRHTPQKRFITEDYAMHAMLDPEQWYEPENSFRD
jgi:hypothetical protein